MCTFSFFTRIQTWWLRDGASLMLLRICSAHLGMFKQTRGFSFKGRSLRIQKYFSAVYDCVDKNNTNAESWLAGAHEALKLASMPQATQQIIFFLFFSGLTIWFMEKKKLKNILRTFSDSKIAIQRSASAPKLEVLLIKIAYLKSCAHRNSELWTFILSAQN